MLLKHGTPGSGRIPVVNKQQRENPTMLKSFKQSGSTGNQNTESLRPGRTGYPTQTAEAARPGSETPKTDSAPAAVSRDDGSKLIVGANIKLKSSAITDCEILVVEGRVEASMNSRDIRIAEGGVFSGKAEIDVAEIRGTFEGELTARKRLVVYATGRVKGTIRYGALMVEEGGILDGNMATQSATQSATATMSAVPTHLQAPAGDAPQANTLEMEDLRSAATLGLIQKRG